MKLVSKQAEVCRATTVAVVGGQSLGQVEIGAQPFCRVKSTGSRPQLRAAKKAAENRNPAATLPPPLPFDPHPSSVSGHHGFSSRPLSKRSGGALCEALSGIKSLRGV